MQTTSFLLQLLSILGVATALGFLQGLTNDLAKLRNQDRPQQCHFNPAYKRSKVETRNTPKPREHGNRSKDSETA